MGASEHDNLLERGFMNSLWRGAFGVLAGFVVAGCACHAKPKEEQRWMMKPAPETRAGGPVMNSVYFGFDKHDLSESSKTTLQRHAEWLKANPEFRLKIEGHADERGTSKYNQALGKRRAEAAARYLEAQGIDSKRISTVSYGESHPVDPAHNEAAWSKNRRDEFNSVGVDKFILSPE